MSAELVFIEGIPDQIADHVTCLCGNEPHIEGFYPCLPTGEVIEPDNSWEHTLYYCERCHRIIDLTTGIVTGQADEYTVSMNGRRFDQ